MDEVIEILKKTTTRMQKMFDETKSLLSEHKDAYENILKSKKTSETRRLQTVLRKTIEYNRLEWLSFHLSLLYILQIFAFKVKTLQISIENMDDQLSKSGILERTKDIEETKKDIDKLMILLEAQYEFVRRIGENRKGGLSYVS
jgi:hypothetical protein